jgi:hypothetical protein
MCHGCFKQNLYVPCLCTKFYMANSNGSLAIHCQQTVKYKLCMTYILLRLHSSEMTPCSPVCRNLRYEGQKTEAAQFFRTSILTYHTICSNKSEDSNLNIHCYEVLNFVFYIIQIYGLIAYCISFKYVLYQIKQSLNLYSDHIFSFAQLPFYLFVHKRIYDRYRG